MRCRLKVKGRVQGIGYRYFTVETAKKFGLTGWVRNCSNGEVECEIQGDEKLLEEFSARLQNGHLWARVDGIEKQELVEKTDEKGFHITD